MVSDILLVTCPRPTCLQHYDSITSITIIHIKASILIWPPSDAVISPDSSRARGRDARPRPSPLIAAAVRARGSTSPSERTTVAPPHPPAVI